jgi:hypothetical protein
MLSNITTTAEAFSYVTRLMLINFMADTIQHYKFLRKKSDILI